MKKLDAPNKKLGRPNIPDEQKRLRLSTTVSPETYDWLIEQRKYYKSIGEVLDFLISNHRNI